MPMHPDFVAIYKNFMKTYCPGSEECDKGKRYYYAWIKQHGYDDTKPFKGQDSKFKPANKTKLDKLPAPANLHEYVYFKYETAEDDAVCDECDDQADYYALNLDVLMEEVELPPPP